jgi:hypothetical protein
MQRISANACGYPQAFTLIIHLLIFFSLPMDIYKIHIYKYMEKFIVRQAGRLSFMAHPLLNVEVEISTGCNFRSLSIM